MRRLAAFVGALAGLWLPALQGATWRMDPEASRLAFEARYEGQAAPGEFRQFAAQLRFDPDHPQEGRLHVTVVLASADMYSSDVNAAIRQREWLNAENVGPAEFTSTEIRRLSGDRFVARGTLQVKGMERAVTLPFAWSASDSSAVMSGRVMLNRTDFDIGTGEWAAPTPIGIGVEVHFQVTWRRSE